MSEQRFRANFDVSIYDSEKEEYISVRERGLEEIAKRMNEQQSTITALKEENEQLRKKTEMDKNDFFISEAKRMRLLAFIEDKELQNEYSEWERRIYDE